MTDQNPQIRVAHQNNLGGNTSKEIAPLEYKIARLEKAKMTAIGSEKQPLRAMLKVGGQSFETTQRFWNSFMARFGLSESVFRYFNHQEVLDRICERKPDTELRFCLDPESKLAFAVSNPKSPVVRPESFMEIARKYRGSDVQYARGVVLSTYVPPSGERNMSIGPDMFANRFVVETPLDGYGKPSIYLSLLRQVCSNGNVAYAPAFRNDITLGDDPGYAIGRALESFDSDEGYSAVRQRFQAAQSSPASLWECRKLFQTVRKVDDKGSLILKAYEKVVGDIYGQYGVANFDAITEKKLRLLPAKCKVYDLLNLASEVATHRSTGTQSMALQAWLGGTISEEYDLEGTSDKKEDFEGVFVKDRDRHPQRPRRRAAN
jgi:hypothetical protein